MESKYVALKIRLYKPGEQKLMEGQNRRRVTLDITNFIKPMRPFLTQQEAGVNKKWGWKWSR